MPDHTLFTPMLVLQQKNNNNSKELKCDSSAFVGVTSFLISYRITWTKSTKEKKPKELEKISDLWTGVNWLPFDS